MNPGDTRVLGKSGLAVTQLGFGGAHGRLGLGVGECPVHVAERRAAKAQLGHGETGFAEDAGIAGSHGASFLMRSCSGAILDQSAWEVNARRPG
jgi:hypothetical protein